MDCNRGCTTIPHACGHLECAQRRKRKRNLENMGVMATVAHWLHKATSIVRRVPRRNSQLTGRKWMNELWASNEHRFFEQFRMRKSVMAHLITLLQERYGFQPFENVVVDESLAILLLILGHGLTFPVVYERIQHSSQAVHAHFYEMLRAIHRMGKDIIKPTDPQFRDVPLQIMHDWRYMPHFKDCVGAIDGTHISIRINGKKAAPFYNRKGVTTTNCLVACDFNLSITYARIGQEGGLHDSSLFSEAIVDEENRLVMPPQGKYYLADSGFPNVRGILVPYKKTRYHFPDFMRARVIRNADENFNYVHSSLRSCIECTFGILKAHFRILRSMMNFPDSTQIEIIYACMAIHNFLRRYDEDDIAMLGEVNSDGDPDDPNDVPSTSQATREADSIYMKCLQNRIRDGLRFRA